jgi:hypothetical protein
MVELPEYAPLPASPVDHHPNRNGRNSDCDTSRHATECPRTRRGPPLEGPKGLVELAPCVCYLLVDLS